MGSGNVSSQFDGNIDFGATNERDIALTKTGTGIFTLTGTNTYTGVTTASARACSSPNRFRFKQRYRSWTSTNLLASSGATMAFNVGGMGEFTSGNIDTIKEFHRDRQRCRHRPRYHQRGRKLTYSTAFASGVG